MNPDWKHDSFVEGWLYVQKYVNKTIQVVFNSHGQISAERARRMKSRGWAHTPPAPPAVYPQQYRNTASWGGSGHMTLSGCDRIQLLLFSHSPTFIIGNTFGGQIYIVLSKITKVRRSKCWGLSSKWSCRSLLIRKKGLLIPLPYFSLSLAIIPGYWPLFLPNN